MKIRLTLLAVFSSAYGLFAADSAVTNLPVATVLNGTDVVYIVNQGVDKQVPFSTLLTAGVATNTWLIPSASIDITTNTAGSAYTPLLSAATTNGFYLMSTNAATKARQDGTNATRLSAMGFALLTDVTNEALKAASDATNGIVTGGSATNVVLRASSSIDVTTNGSGDWTPSLSSAASNAFWLSSVNVLTNGSSPTFSSMTIGDLISTNTYANLALSTNYQGSNVVGAVASATTAVGATYATNLANQTHTLYFMATTSDTNNTVRAKYGGYITSVDVYADSVTSAGVDIWKTNYAGYPPSVSGTITAGLYAALNNTNHINITTLTGWATNLTAGDYFTFNMVSNTAATKVHVDVNYTTP